MKNHHDLLQNNKSLIFATIIGTSISTICDYLGNNVYTYHAINLAIKCWGRILLPSAINEQFNPRVIAIKSYTIKAALFRSHSVSRIIIIHCLTLARNTLPGHKHQLISGTIQPIQCRRRYRTMMYKNT